MITKFITIKINRMFRIFSYEYRSLLASLLGSYAIIILLPFSFIFYNAENLELSIHDLKSFIIYFIYGFTFFLVLSLCTRKLIKLDLSPAYAVIFLYLFIAAWIIPNSTGPLDGLRDGQVFSFSGDTIYQLGKLFIINLITIYIYYKNRKLFKDMVIYCFIISCILVVYTGVFFKSNKSDINFENTKLSETTRLADLSSNKNIVIISFDAIQGDIIDDIFRQNPLLLEEFDGFTFYPNTTSVAPHTSRSNFFTLLGSIPPLTATTKELALKNQKRLLPYILANSGNYKVNTYGPLIGGLTCNETLLPKSCFPKDAIFEQYENTHNLDSRKINDSFFYSALRVIPPYIVNGVNNIINKIFTTETGFAMATQDKGKHAMGRTYYEYLHFLKNLNVRHTEPVFSFQHYVFTHEPVTFDRFCSYKYGKDITQNIKSAKEQSLCVISLMKKTINNFKNIGLYDNSMIIFMSDHAMSSRYNTDSAINFGGFMPAARYNSLLMVKSFNSKGKAVVSQKPASLLDIAPTVCYSIMNHEFCNNQGYQGLNLDSPNFNKNRSRKLLMYVGGKKGLGKDYSRYYSDLSLVKVSEFYGDVKVGLEKHFQNTHPNYKKEFSDELLLNGDFSSGLSHWSRHGNVRKNIKGVSVNLANHLFQDVDVEENGEYLISYDINCATQASNEKTVKHMFDVARAQVNWFDAAGAFLSATLELHDCYGGNYVINKIIKPPTGATIGRFYVGTQDDRYVTINSVSFRKR